MRIYCAWCKKDLGDKCPACGSEDIIFCEADREHAQCLSCSGIFAIGAGAPTATICEDCRSTVRTEIGRRLTEQDIVDRAARPGDTK
jgi:ribosomal protein S27E